jgi:hypothetical protein
MNACHARRMIGRSSGDLAREERRKGVFDAVDVMGSSLAVTHPRVYP